MQDSSEQHFWDQRYQQNVTPWEHAGLPAQFEYFAALMPQQLQRVLIPGCGSAAELAYLVTQHKDVMAIDFSDEAICRARARLPEALHACLQQADFFELDEQQPWDWVYERAFLCALPQTRWSAYVRKMAALIRTDGVLGGYFFLRPTFRGPPFGCDLDSLQQLMAPYFELASEQHVEGSMDVFKPDEYWLNWRRC